ncbi:MAG: YjfB family protein [Gammaproteobacteria bacterium]|nr:YjfB family protein [Gammaproteobacteria bacterium]
MDINSISSGVVTQNVAQKTGDAVGVTVARKALDIQSSQAAQLIDSVKESVPAPSEPHLGNHINVKA